MEKKETDPTIAVMVRVGPEMHVWLQRQMQTHDMKKAQVMRRLVRHAMQTGWEASGNAQS